ncbi:PrpF domain-containing protein [Actinopolyspora xinjiangensis]|uniref:PrpF domain-containing protein n=1 Tax=Actinopolyspora xinjiangensis TaxID=405564 RepID=UPI00147AF7AD|nr:PrpF domain-containing protein [Actinopolyspora xinjiangensis]
MTEQGFDSITKIALIAMSEHPLFDLDYQFVQVLPNDPMEFDLRGSCGHSVLASTVVASRLGWIDRLAPGIRARVRVLNNGDQMVCEVDESVRDRVTFTAHFLHHPEIRLGSLLSGGEPVTGLSLPLGIARISEISVGNPYVFVSAEEFGVNDVSELLGENPDLYEKMNDVRREVALKRGFPENGAFPKVAALLPDGDGTVAVRAISVPSWHPTIALTGAVCLGVASKIEGTIPNQLAGRAAHPEEPLLIRTPGNTVTTTAAVSGNRITSTLSWASVPHKEVVFRGALDIKALQPHVRGKESLWLSPT